MSQNTGKKSLGFHLIFWLGSVCLLLLDQWTKYLACIHLKDRIPVSVIEDVFCLQYLENRGAAFGILQGQKVFFVLITLVFFVPCILDLSLSAGRSAFLSGLCYNDAFIVRCGWKFY